MVERRVCTFCGEEIEPGTGRMYIKKDGVVYHFCTSKCFKNMVHLGRVPRRTTWTRYYEREKQVRLKGVPEEAPEKKARKLKKAEAEEQAKEEAPAKPEEKEPAKTPSMKPTEKPKAEAPKKPSQAKKTSAKKQEGEKKEKSSSAQEAKAGAAEGEDK